MSEAFFNLLVLIVACVLFPSLDHFVFKKNWKSAFRDATYPVITFFLMLCVNQLSKTELDIDDSRLVVLDKLFNKKENLIVELNREKIFKNETIVSKKSIESFLEESKVFELYDWKKLNIAELRKNDPTLGIYSTENFNIECVDSMDMKLNDSPVLKTSNCFPFNIYYEKVQNGKNYFLFTDKFMGRSIANLEGITLAKFESHTVKYNDSIYSIVVSKDDHLTNYTNSYAHVILLKHVQ